MNRIDQKFLELREKRKKAFIAFVTAGDPRLSFTEELVPELESAGVDLVELGVPFSDPLADGPVIQAASERALKAGVTSAKIFKSVERIRKRTSIPIALMTYANPVFYFGVEKFFKAAHSAGVDGLIVPDLPPEEAPEWIRQARASGTSLIFFLSPMTSPERLSKIVKVSSGFIYYVSLTGVTGARAALPADVIRNVRLAKSKTTKPVCVGFGVSSAAQVRSIAAAADGVIVGSAIVQQIQINAGRRDAVSRVCAFVKNLSKGLKDG